MGIPAKKGKLVEVALTTEIVQDGMLFITIMLLITIYLYYSNTLYFIKIYLTKIPQKCTCVLRIKRDSI